MATEEVDSESSEEEEQPVKKNAKNSKAAENADSDKEGGDEAKFKEIAEAYENISKGNSNSNNISYDYDDIMRDIFDNGDFANMFNNSYGNFRHRYNVKGADTNMTLSITLEESYKGTSREISVGVKRLKLNLKPGSYTGLKLKLKGYGQRGNT